MYGNSTMFHRSMVDEILWNDLVMKHHLPMDVLSDALYVSCQGKVSPRDNTACACDERLTSHHADTFPPFTRIGNGGTYTDRKMVKNTIYNPDRHVFLWVS
jgi:hypothetical protein